jgi:hypothetical protein
VLGGTYSQHGEQHGEPLHSPFSLSLCGDSAEDCDEEGPHGEDGDGRPPLALAVSHKFAGDTVSLWRVFDV